MRLRESRCADTRRSRRRRCAPPRLRSKGHEDAGIAPTDAFLERLKLNTIDGYDVRKQVLALVADHLAPGHFHKSFLKGEKVSDGAFRRLAQRVEPDLLYRVARADCLGRTGDFKPDAMEWFIAHINELKNSGQSAGADFAGAARLGTRHKAWPASRANHQSRIRIATG